MGTRNLTCVVKDGKFKIAQYCQWDGYPSGQGVDVLEFARSLPQNHDRFVTNLAKCRFIEEAEHKALVKKAGIESKDGWMNLEESEKFQKALPQLHRDMGAKVLTYVLENKSAEVLLADNHGFAADGLFCEWAYVIDLDKNTLEVYKGFGKEPLAAAERFASLPHEGEYQPVSLLKEYKLHQLPTKKEFLELEKEGEEA